jgi:hypothetical protein
VSGKAKAKDKANKGGCCDGGGGDDDDDALCAIKFNILIWTSSSQKFMLLCLLFLFPL